jgi:hypothetical protein
MADQGNRPHRTTKEKKPHTGGPNPKAFAFATPGRLQKTAARSHDVCRLLDPQKALLTGTGQRKAPPRSSRRPPPRRSTPNHCRCRWPSRRRQNYTHQVAHPSLHQADPLSPDRTAHSRHIETAASYLYGMSRRLARQHDRHCKGCRYCAAHD